MDDTARGLIRDLRPALDDVHTIDERRTAGALAVTALLAAGVVAAGAWGAEAGGAGYALFAAALLAMGAVHHRVAVLGHEAAHGLLFRERRFNDAALHLLAASVGSLPMTYRRTHLSHHGHLGGEGDLERYGYADPPRSPRALAAWAAARITGWEAVRRLLHLLTTVRLGAAPAPSGAYATPPADWLALALVQGGLLALFAVTVGPVFYILLWLLPLLTVSRTLIGLRAFLEHSVAEDVRLLSFDCGPVERAVMGPLFFHLHAEHHLFPRIPTWRLPEARDRIRAHPAYPRLVRRFPGYGAALRPLVGP